MLSWSSSSSIAGSRFISSRLIFRYRSQSALNFPFTRFHSTHAPVRSLRTLRCRPGLIISSGIVLVGSVAIFESSRPVIYTDDDSSDAKHHVPRQAPLSSLFRSYLVYSMCSVPLLVDWSPSIIYVFYSIPGIKQVTEFFIRHTFFSQFVGGDTAEQCIPVIQQLRAENKGCLFSYSMELDGVAGPSSVNDRVKPIVEEIIRSIDVAADFEDQFSSSIGRKTWISIKMTALVPDTQSLRNLSKYLLRSRSKLATPIPFPGYPDASDLAFLDSSDRPFELTSEDLIALRELRDDLYRICTRAKERGVRILIDAEYSWSQPAIDAYTLALTRRFNQLTPDQQIPNNIQPLIYGTYQAYLRRAPPHLKQSLQDAREGNYSLGVKLVRGAYLEYEIAAHHSSSSSTSKAVSSLSNEPDPPVFSTKAETDECYNSCAKMIVHNVKRDTVEAANNLLPRIGVLFGTHNLDSCQTILEELVKEDLASDKDGDTVLLHLEDKVLERLTFGQLLGMKDDLTEYLVSRVKSRSPVVLKYVPYGALFEVIPYLSRRAIENKSVLGGGGASDERKRVGKEIRRRILGFF